MRTEHLTIYLIKDGASPLKDPQGLESYPVGSDVPYAGTLFLRPREETVPSWVTFVKPALRDQLPELRNANTSAVLIIGQSGRQFAVTFGHGRTLLAPGSIESDFGLKVVLNAVHPDRLRSVDMRTFEELTVHTRRQASRASSLPTFGLDINRDLLRAVTGEPEDPKVAKLITGADALAITAKLKIQELGAKCTQVLKQYRGKRYQDSFGFIDYLKSVRDPATVQKLDDDLIAELKKAKIGSVHLAPPELIDWAQHPTFSFTHAAKDRFDDLEIGDYVNAQSGVATLDIDHLKQHRVVLHDVDDDGAREERWSVYDCITFESGLNGQTYVLTGGKWFQVAKSLNDRVNDNVAKTVTNYPFLVHSAKKEREEDYCERISKSSSGVQLLDQCFVRCSDATTDIEVADLLTKKKEFIHLKRKMRSATLSHLFAQGAISAEALLRDEQFREQARSHLGPGFKQLIPRTRPNPSEYTVAYGIIGTSRGVFPKNLPFFSKLHFFQASTRLRTLGFKVTISNIATS